MKVFTAFWLCLFCGLGPALAQTTTETTGSPPPPTDADVLFQVDVHMDSLRFDAVPNHARLDVNGVNQTGGTSIIRTNVPKKPVAGTTYRNVRLHVTVSSRLSSPRNAALRKRPSMTARATR